MPKAGRRRTRRAPGTGRGAKKKKADDRPVMFAAFDSEKSQSEAKLDCMYDDEVESSTEESSDPPSPLLHRPYIPDELADRANIRAAFWEANATYEADTDDEPLNRCCGLWIRRDDKKKTTLVLTSAYLIRTKDPSSVIVHLLDGTTALARLSYLQEHYECIPRAHLGMTFTSIKFLDPICTERMRRKHNIESGLIVEQVSKESNAEKLGIRKGDIIERLNGQYISTTTELEKMLLDIGGDHFPKAKVLNAKLDIRIQIFRATKLCRRARNLTVTVSDCGEDIIEDSVFLVQELP
ncbi:hypothetical protein ACQ4PT_035943 [Festuca glaucescens]